MAPPPGPSPQIGRCSQILQPLCLLCQFRSINNVIGISQAALKWQRLAQRPWLVSLAASNRLSFRTAALLWFASFCCHDACLHKHKSDELPRNAFDGLQRLGIKSRTGNTCMNSRLGLRDHPSEQNVRVQGLGLLWIDVETCALPSQEHLKPGNAASGIALTTSHPQSTTNQPRLALSNWLLDPSRSALSRCHDYLDPRAIFLISDPIASWPLQALFLVANRRRSQTRTRSLLSDSKGQETRHAYVRITFFTHFSK